MPQRLTAKSIALVLTSEREIDRGWAYDVVVNRPEGRSTEHVVTLSWADHDHWCGGASAPSRVAEAVVRYAATRRELPEEFDCSTVRRWFPDLDAELRETI